MVEHKYVVMNIKTGLFVASLSDEAFKALCTHETPVIPPEHGQYVLTIEELPRYVRDSNNG